MPNQSKNMFPKQVVKLGILFGVILAVLNLLNIVFNLIPILGILLSLMFGVVAFLISIAAGYVTVNALNIKKENLSDAIMKTLSVGLIIGIISGIAAGIAGIVSSLILYSQYNFFTSPTIVTYVFSFVGAVIASVILSVLWSILGGVLGTYYPSTNLPAGVKMWVDRAVKKANEA